MRFLVKLWCEECWLSTTAAAVRYLQGMPNAGKSSLLEALTGARTKVGGRPLVTWVTCSGLHSVPPPCAAAMQQYEEHSDCSCPPHGLL